MARRKSFIDYRSLFGDDTADSWLALTRELENLFAVQPAPTNYRENLRSQLMSAARDETFYRRDPTRRFILAMAVVIVVLVSVVGLIAWRTRGPALLKRVSLSD